ncbi:MAG: nitroreductase/quinone reductase family protein [Candidatus Limnocylindrales bacterium]
MPVPPGELAWNAAMIADFRAHEGAITTGPLAGSNMVLLTTTGAKSGEPRTVPIGYTRDGQRYVLVGSNSGKPEAPQWVANIAANPNVTVEVGGETFIGTATITAGAERVRLLDAHIAAIPVFAGYEAMAGRQLPVVVLER